MALLLILISIPILIDSGFVGFISYWIVVGLFALFVSIMEYSEKREYDDDPTLYHPSWDDMDDYRDYD